MDHSTTDLSNVRRPIETANGLPNGHYIDAGIFEEEKQAVLFDNWAGLDVGASVPEVGDAVPVTFLGMPMLIVRDKQIESIDLDNAHQTADADFSNNSFPAKISKSRLEIYKSKSNRRNLMADMLVELKNEGKDAPGSDNKSTDGKADEKKVPLKAAPQNTDDADDKSDGSELSDEEKNLLKRLMKKWGQ